MLAGSLNKRARFERLERVPAGAGGYSEQWVEELTVWAQFSPERGRERVQQGRVSSDFAGVLRVRSSVGARTITQAHRVVLDGIVYNIRSISNPHQRNDMLEMVLETDGTAS